MTPEEILRPFIKHYQLPDSLVRRLFLLIQTEIQNNFPDFGDDPGILVAKGLKYVLDKLSFVDSPLTVTIQDLTGIKDDDFFLYHLSASYHRGIKRTQELRQEIARCERWIEQDVDVAYNRKWKKEYEQQLNREEHSFIPSLFYDLLRYQVSFRVPDKIRPQHTHVIGVSGTGKSELIKQLVYQDMQTESSVVVMAPKGNLISDIARIPSEKICITSWENVGLNLLDLDPFLIIYVFEALLEAEPTPKQKAFLTQALKSVSTLTDFRRLVAGTRGEYKETAEQVSWRLDLFPPVVEEILSRPTTLDIAGIMDSGVLLVDTSELREGSSFIGRFIFALIAHATMRRTSQRPCYVYIDECQDYLTDYMERMLDQAREKKVGLTLAHQNLSQLTPRLEQSILGTAIKFVGRVVPQDASKLAPLLKLHPSQLTHKDDLAFVLYAHGFLNHPLHFHVTPGFLDQFPKYSPSHSVSPRPASSESTEDPGTKASKEW